MTPTPEDMIINPGLWLQRCEEQEAVGWGSISVDLALLAGLCRRLIAAEERLAEFLAPEEIPLRLQRLRAEARLTQVQLAERSGLPQSHISRLEAGMHRPTLVTLERIASGLGVPVSELMTVGPPQQ